MSFMATSANSAPNSPNSDTFRYLNLFGDVFERIRTEYVEETPDKKLIESAINGMLTSLDPHSSYLDEKAFNDMQVQTKGEFGGLGIEVTMENGLVKVVSPIDDTPAHKAGVMAGDLIAEIDGEQVMGLTLPQAVEKLRGPVGTIVKIAVVREGANEPIEFKIPRAIIKIQSVKYRAEKDVAYIRITSFNENTASTVEKAVQELKAQIGKDLKGYVIDMRNNPGGLLDQAVAVSDDFLEQGEIVSTRGRNKDSIKRFNAKSGDIAESLPIVVLVNSGSASASEIVAGALQDHKRAIVMGTRSFGKGSVQTVIPIPSHGAIRLTTSRYYTPSGRAIQQKGIDPDIVVEQAKVEAVKSHERHESDLRGSLQNDENKKPANENSAQPPVQPETKNNSNGLKKGKDKEDADSASKDYQLARALDLIRGLSIYKTNSATSGSKK